MKDLLRIAAAFALIASCGPLFAQAPYPAKPIRIVVPYPAGPSGADGLARLLGPKLNKWNTELNALLKTPEVRSD